MSSKKTASTTTNDRSNSGYLKASAMVNRIARRIDRLPPVRIRAYDPEQLYTRSPLPLYYMEVVFQAEEEAQVQQDTPVSVPFYKTEQGGTRTFWG